MKRLTGALMAIALLLGTPVFFASPAMAHDAGSLEKDWRHHSPFTAGLVITPIALTAFLADVPVYLLIREQPFTAGLTEMELVDGYNPVTGDKSGPQYDPHGVDITDNY